MVIRTRQPTFTMDDLKATFPKKVLERRIPELMTLAESKKRRKAPPQPEGSITLCQAERKYGIDHNTIRRWTKKGLVSTIKVEDNINCVYVDEKALAELVGKYMAFPGRGKRTALQTA